MKKVLVLFSILVVGLFAKPVVTVSIIPQKYFVEQIAGDSVDVNIMVGKGDSPATYEPKPKQMSDLAKSDIYFSIGVPFEKAWLKKFASTNPKLLMVKTDEKIEKLAMAAHHHHGEEHADHEEKHEDHAKHEDHEEHEDHAKHEGHEEHEGHEGHHHHAGMADPHVWLDPRLVKIQANTIADALIKKYPKNKALYKKNLKDFQKKLTALNKEIETLLKDKKGKKFLVYHPAWGYFANRYGLKQEAIEIEGKEPKPKALQEIINEAKEDGVHVIFVQPQFSQKAAKVIASQINGKVVAMDPLATDWEAGLKQSAKVLANWLK